MTYLFYIIATTLETLNLINNDTLGRDKLARLVQYTSRMIRDLLEYRTTDEFILERLRYIEHAAGQFRRLMRMGRCFELAYSALDGLKDLDDPILKLTITIRKIALSLFLYCDHLIWLMTHSFMTGDCEKWFHRANQFWLLSILAHLCRTFYDITLVYEKHLIACRRSVYKSSDTRRSTLCKLMKANLSFLTILDRNLILEVIRSSCDVFIPLTSLGFLDLNATVIGTLGGIASIIGLYQIVYPQYKLIPA